LGYVRWHRLLLAIAVAWPFGAALADPQPEPGDDVLRINAPPEELARVRREGAACFVRILLAHAHRSRDAYRGALRSLHPVVRRALGTNCASHGNHVVPRTQCYRDAVVTMVGDVDLVREARRRGDSGERLKADLVARGHFLGRLLHDACGERPSDSCVDRNLSTVRGHLRSARRNLDTSFDEMAQWSLLRFQCRETIAADPCRGARKWAEELVVDPDSTPYRPRATAASGSGGQGSQGSGRGGGGGAGGAAGGDGRDNPELRRQALFLSHDAIAALNPPPPPPGNARPGSSSSSSGSSSSSSSAPRPAGGVPGTGREPHSPFDPVVDLSFFGLGYTRYECPKHLERMDCVPEAGRWAPRDGAGNAAVTAGNVNSTFDALRDVMLRQLADHQLELMAQAYISALMVMNPANVGNGDLFRRRKDAFTSAASCASGSTRQAIEAQFNRAVTIPGQDAATLRQRLTDQRATLGTDLLETARRARQARDTAASLAPRFANEGPCGFFAYRLNDPTRNRDCDADFGRWRAAQRIHQEAQANYPLLEEQVDGTPVLDRIARASDAAGALAVYDRVLNRSIDASMSRVTEICQDPLKAGKAALFNPVISRSFLGEEPDAAWLYCAAYAQNSRNDELIGIGRMSMVMASVIFTGGFAGAFFGVASLGMTIHSAADRWERIARDRDEYLAGVGDVSLYLAAREDLDSFYGTLARDLALDVVGLAPEIGMLRAWMQARRLASLGRVAQLPAATAQRLLRWYRARANRIFGQAAQRLSDAQLTALARIEDSGVSMTQLRRRVGCPI
jgi:hypothetical protein